MMMNNSGGDDCFFYYNSNCAKGSLCPFRHEPAALKTEIICTYWQQGRCTRPNCMFRHSQIVKKRTQTICHWESQASGCINPNCHFLHVTQKTQGYMAIIPQPATTKNTIIINKKKFGDLIVPTNPGATNQPDPANPETEKPVDTPSSSVMEVTSEGSPSGIKTRLGVKARLGAKSRLGPQMVPPPKSVKFFGEFEDDNEKVAVFEFSDYDSEEEHLRADAIKTIDLRNRLSTKQSDEEEDSSSVQVMSSVVVPPKKSKKDKKEKKEKEKDKKKKKEKDKKKEKKDKERVTKETKRMVIAKGRKSKIDELESDAVSNETSLAIQIASKREISEQSRFRSDIKERIGRRREEVKQTRGPISKDVGNRDDDKVSKRRTEENIYNVVERDDKVSKRRPEENIYNVVERDDKLSKRKVEEHIYNVIRKRRFQESDNSANKRSRSSPDRTSCKKKSTEETRCHDEESKSVSNLSPEKVSPSKEKEKSKKSVSGDLDEESNIGPNKIKKRKPENFTDHLKKTRKDLKAEAPTKNSGGKSSDVNLSVDSSFDEKGIGFNDHDVTLLESSDDEKVSTTNLSENDDIMKQLNDYINS